MNCVSQSSLCCVLLGQWGPREVFCCRGEGGDEDSVFVYWAGGRGVCVTVTAHPCQSLSPGSPCFLAGAPPARRMSALPVGTPLQVPVSPHHSRSQVPVCLCFPGFVLAFFSQVSALEQQFSFKAAKNEELYLGP